MKINQRTGEIREYERWSTKRVQHYRGGNSGSGFLVINDGLAAAEQLSQLVTWWVDVTGHQTAEFTMHDELHQAHRDAHA